MPQFSKLGSSSLDVSHIIQHVPRTEGGFHTFGEQLRAIAHAELQSTRPVDPRLHAIQQRAAAPNALGGSEEVPSDGGFLVQPEFSRSIVERMYQTGEIFARCMQIPTGANGFKFPQFDESSRVAGSRLGGAQVQWDDEGGNLKPASLRNVEQTQKPNFALTELVPKKLAGYIHVTNELSLDSMAFDTWAPYAFSQELMFTFENAIVNGTGAGQPLGVLNSPALVLAPKVPGQQALTVVSQNVEQMLASFWSKSYNSTSAIWLYNQALLSQLASLATVVGVAGSQSNLFQWASSRLEDDLLAGFPCLQSEYCAVPGTPGDLILCDFSRYCVVIRELMRAEMSIHVKFISDQNTFRFVMRADGQPIDRSPIIPANGTQVTSAFVALASRN